MILDALSIHHKCCQMRTLRAVFDILNILNHKTSSEKKRNLNNKSTLTHFSDLFKPHVGCHHLVLLILVDRERERDTVESSVCQPRPEEYMTESVLEVCQRKPKYSLQQLYFNNLLDANSFSPAGRSASRGFPRFAFHTFEKHYETE